MQTSLRPLCWYRPPLSCFHHAGLFQPPKGRICKHQDVGVHSTRHCSQRQLPWGTCCCRSFCRGGVWSPHIACVSWHLEAGTKSPLHLHMFSSSSGATERAATIVNGILLGCTSLPINGLLAHWMPIKKGLSWWYGLWTYHYLLCWHSGWQIITVLVASLCKKKKSVGQRQTQSLFLVG